MAEHEDIYWNSFLPVFFDRMSCIMRKNMTKEVSEFGLTSAHSIYLIALKLQDGQTLVSLSKFLDLDPANTNRVIKVLKEKGFVYDDRKSESNKKYSIYLTDAGKKLAKRVMDNITESTNKYFEGVPREDIIHMRNTLIAVLRNMDLDLEGYMHSKYEDPYYTHLQTVPLDGDYPAEPRRLTKY